MDISDKVVYVPAGLEAWPTRMGQIFVKLGKNPKKSIHKGPGYKIIKTFDRTLHVVYESSKAHRLLDKDFKFDYMVPYQNPAELRGRVGLVLVNPVHASTNFINVFRPHGIKIISDSGGFQMLRGVSDFVHPDDVLDFYNRHTDIGMPLDLPMRTAYEAEFFDAASRMMKANDEYMIPRLKPGRTLALVSHGSSLEMRQRRLDHIYRKTPVLAIAGLNTLTDSDLSRHLQALGNAMYVISQTRQDVGYYHFLGVTSRFWLIIYAMLVGTGYVKSCGGDSVSHRMAAITGMYKNTLSYRPTTPLQIEKRTHRSVNTSCTCAVCQAVGDLNVLADFQFCESHLIWYSEQEKDHICSSVAAYLEGKQSLKAVYSQWLPTGQHKLLEVAVGYIEKVVSNGFSPIKAPRMSIFDGVESGHLESDQATRERYQVILRNYEKFHKKRFLK